MRDGVCERCLERPRDHLAHQQNQCSSINGVTLTSLVFWYWVCENLIVKISDRIYERPRAKLMGAIPELQQRGRFPPLLATRPWEIGHWEFETHII